MVSPLGQYSKGRQPPVAGTVVLAPPPPKPPPVPMLPPEPIELPAVVPPTLVAPPVPGALLAAVLPPLVTVPPLPVVPPKLELPPVPLSPPALDVPTLPPRDPPLPCVPVGLAAQALARAVPRIVIASRLLFLILWPFCIVVSLYPVASSVVVQTGFRRSADVAAVGLRQEPLWSS